MVLSIAVSGMVAQQPVFRARTELVRIDALVTDDGAPVAGLTASDFAVRDNGVLQRVTAAGAVEAVQLGVVLDVSGSMTGERLEIARTATSALLDQLTRGDRFAIVAFADQIARVAKPGASVADATTALDLIRAGGGTALFDGLYAGILQSDQGPGPKLLVLMTDGRNNSSWLPGTAVIDSARRHETVIYPVFVGANRRSTTDAIRLNRSDNDHLALLQEFVWQQYDTFPEFPALGKFLDFWEQKIEGPIFSVTVAHARLITPAEIREMRRLH